MEVSLSTGPSSAASQHRPNEAAGKKETDVTLKSTAKGTAVDNGLANGSKSTINETIQILLEQHIVENQKLLHESWINLDKIADYCDANYLQSERKDVALDETKNYTTRALASVANQIHNYASNLLTLFDLQLSGLNQLETQANSVASAANFYAERCSRKEIGKLTKPKLLPNPTPKVIKPLYPERYAAKKRRSNYYSSSGYSTVPRQDSVGSGSSGGGSIDFTLLDDIGEAHRIYERGRAAKGRGGRAAGGGIYSAGSLAANGYTPTVLPGGSGATLGGTSTGSGQASAGMAGGRHWMPSVKSATLRPSKSSNLSALYPPGSTGADPTGAANRTPAPTIRPPTPPLGASTMSRFSSLSRGAGTSGSSASKDYRSLGLIVAPPQLPNNYQKPNSQQSTANTATAASSKQSQPAKPAEPVLPKSLNLQPNTQPQPYRSPTTNPFLNDDDEPAASSATTTKDTSWIPSTYLQKVVALYDYNADKDDELTFKENCIIYVTAKNDDGWWEGVMNGITGLFPGNYVEPCH